MKKNEQNMMQEIQNHLKEVGFVFQGSEIYGGLANTWDYGPLGTLLLQNIRQFWQAEFIKKEKNNYLIDSKILMNPNVWVASGHVNKFSDPLIENRINNKRYRADHLIDFFASKKSLKIEVDKMSFDEMENFIKQNILEYDNSKADWSKVREFKLMFETYQGVVEEKKDVIYLRPETAQGIFVNFNNVQKSVNAKVPFGIGQIGKVFRNEVTPGNFIFRTREFEQMELEFFTNPKEDEKYFDYYVKKSHEFMLKLGLDDQKVRLRKHNQEELAHYSKATTDIEYEFPFGWGELMGIANRTDFDLKAHSLKSKVDLSYLNPQTNERFFPYVIEPSVGLDRLALAILVNSYKKENVNDETRIILKLNPQISPFLLAILPLNKKVHAGKAQEVFNYIKTLNFDVSYDDSGSIGKRYRKQDAIGTPFCITIIDDTSTKNLITIRDRDSMEQKTLDLNELLTFLKKVREI